MSWSVGPTPIARDANGPTAVSLSLSPKTSSEEPRKRCLRVRDPSGKRIALGMRIRFGAVSQGSWRRPGSRMNGPGGSCRRTCCSLRTESSTVCKGYDKAHACQGTYLAPCCSDRPFQNSVHETQHRCTQLRMLSFRFRFQGSRGFAMADCERLASPPQSSMPLTGDVTLTPSPSNQEKAVSDPCLLLRAAIHPDEGSRLTGLRPRLAQPRNPKTHHAKATSSACLRATAINPRSSQAKASFHRCLRASGRQTVIHTREASFPLWLLARLGSRSEIRAREGSQVS
jgi:hypothetical protein